MRADDVDLAQLLLNITNGPLVMRAELNARWSAVASDIASSAYAIAYSKRARGSFTTHVLRSALRDLEKLGAIQRVDQPSAVIIGDRELLTELVQAWDAAQADN